MDFRFGEEIIRMRTRMSNGNVRDFVPLARRYHRPGGIRLAHPRRFSLTSLIEALGRVLGEAEANDWPGGVRWLVDWSASALDMATHNHGRG